MHEHFRMRGYAALFDSRLAYAGTADMQLVTVWCMPDHKTQNTLAYHTYCRHYETRAGQSCALGTQAIQQLVRAEVAAAHRRALEAEAEGQATGGHAEGLPRGGIGAHDGQVARSQAAVLHLLDAHVHARVLACQPTRLPTPESEIRHVLGKHVTVTA